MLSDGIVSFWSEFDKPVAAPTMPGAVLLRQTRERLARVWRFRAKG